MKNVYYIVEEFDYQTLNWREIFRTGTESEAFDYADLMLECGYEARAREVED